MAHSPGFITKCRYQYQTIRRVDCCPNDAR